MKRLLPVILMIASSIVYTSHNSRAHYVPTSGQHGAFTVTLCGLHRTYDEAAFQKRKQGASAAAPAYSTLIEQLRRLPPAIKLDIVQLMDNRDFAVDTDERKRIQGIINSVWKRYKLEPDVNARMTRYVLMGEKDRRLPENEALVLFVLGGWSADDLYFRAERQQHEDYISGLRGMNHVDRDLVLEITSPEHEKPCIARHCEIKEILRRNRIRYDGSMQNVRHILSTIKQQELEAARAKEA